MRNTLHRMALAIALTCLGLSAGCAVHAPEHVRAAPAAGMADRPISLFISMENGTSVTLDAARFQKLPRKTVKAMSRDGVEVTYTGVALAELLELVETPAGDRLRGRTMAHYIVAEGSDGYRVTLSITEADDAFGAREIVVADQFNGGPLPENARPLQLIVPRDKRTSRWVRTLTKIEVRRVP